MTPIRLNIPSSSSPQHDEENQEEYPSQALLTLKPTSPLSTACSSSTPCQEKKDHGVRDQPEKGEDQKEGEEEKLLDQADPGSGAEDDDHLPLRSSPPIMSMGSKGENIISEGYNSSKPVVIFQKQEAHDHGDDHHHGRSSSTDQNCNVNGSTHVMKWMSSKMRVMKKMAANYNPDHQTPSDPKPTACNELQQPASSPNFQSRQRSPPLYDDDNSTTINSPKNIRVCSDCNTTKTPLWRSGPQGPKSLCNACGIRQRKARRAAAAAAAANGTQLLSVETSNNMRSSSSTCSASNKGTIKEKRSSSSGSTDGFNCRQYKKRCNKLGAGGPRSRKKIRFDEFTISTSLSKSSGAAFHQAVFPRDEEEAAILLMALSCGLVRG